MGNKKLFCVFLAGLWLGSNVSVFSVEPITIDGNFSDWAAVSQVVSDQVSDVSSGDVVDWLSASAVAGETAIYLRYSTTGSIDFAQNAWRYQLFLDTDRDPRSGFRGLDGSFSAGAEFLIEGAALFRYSGTSTNWVWSYIGPVAYAIDGTDLEMGISRGDVDADADVDVLLVGNNAGLVDYLSDGALPIRASSEADRILVDGTFSDWDSDDLIGVDYTGDVSPGDEVDWVKLWAASENGSLYLSYQTAAAIDFGASAQRYIVYVDVDTNQFTGFRGANDGLKLGADYKIEGGALYAYEGSGNDSVWAWVIAVPTGVTDDRLEMGVNESALGLVAPYSIRFQLEGVNTTSKDFAPNSGAGYAFPRASGVRFIDGSFDDWGNSQPIGVDPTGDVSSGDIVDWVNVWATNYEGQLFISYQTVSNIDFVANAWRYGIYIDADDNPSTGFRGVDGSFGLGAEFLIEGGTLLQYIGDGQSWNWSAVGAQAYAYSGNRLEFSLLESSLNLPASYAIRFLFVGNNDTTPDYASDNRAGFLYSTLAPDAAIAIDGRFSEWTEADLIGSDATGDISAGDHVDWQNLWARSENGKLYLSYRTVSHIDFVSNAWRYAVYLDTDADKGTGYHGSDGSYAIGAEYLMEGAALYKYVGDGTDWSWSPSGVVDIAVGGNRAELALDESGIGLTGEYNVRVMLRGNNPTTIDYAPYSKSGYGYSTITPPPSIAVDGNFADWVDSDLVLTDPSGDVSAGDIVDWESLWLRSQDGSLFLSYQTAAAVDMANNGWRYEMFLDTDMRPSTGFKGLDGGFGIGADYLLENQSVFKYAGGGTDWSWTQVGTYTSAYNGGRVEIAVLDSLLGLNANYQIGVQLVGNNPTTADYAPDSRNGVIYSSVPSVENVNVTWTPSGDTNVIGYNIYRRIKRFNSESAVHLSMDGSFSDWSNIVPATSAPYPPEDMVHMQDIWVANDTTALYIRVKFSSALPDALEPSVFLDIDRSYGTGSGSKMWRGLTIGAELWYDIRGFDGNGSPILRRRQWDNNWAGPYSYDEFESQGPTDPVHAWTGAVDLASDVWAAGDDGFYDSGTAVPLQMNSFELCIPFTEIEGLTGITIDPRKFGVDMMFSAYMDQFPTIGYAPKSPTKFSYGYEKINDNPVIGNAYVDHPVGGVEYEYSVFEVRLDGAEEPVGSPFQVYVSRAHPADLNVSIRDTGALRVSFIYPESPDVDFVRVVRRTDRFAASPDDGVAVREVVGAPDQNIVFDDEGLTTGQAYFYTAFGMSLDGRASLEYWDSKDRSIPAVIRGPIPGISATNDYMIYFSSWDDRRVQFAKKYNLVILHPGGGAPLITPAQVSEIKAGLDAIPGTPDDVTVIGYVSIGEDFGINGNTIRNNSSLGIYPGTNDYPYGSWNSRGYNWPRKIDGQTSGPTSYDFATDEILFANSSDPKYQFPSFYVDMIDYFGRGGPGQDGLPDQNVEWGGLFVDPGNPAWQEFIRYATADKDYVSGLDYVLGDGPNQLDCDGVFLDTVGVPTPWSAWYPGSFYGDFYWLKDGHIDFMAKIGVWYPTKIIMPNRPMQFVFPGYAGKRYDDFRAVVNSIFWESFTADMDHWWPGFYAWTFEDNVVSAQDNSDGRGFTTLTLDYWNVMIDAEEGGEFQRAPWYTNIQEYVERSEAHDFLAHAQGSRSLADLADYVYLYHNASATELPELFVHSIRAEDMLDGTILVTVNISNQGQPTTNMFTVTVQLNDTFYADEVVHGLDRYQLYSFQRVVTKQSIGNNLLVHVDANDDVAEYDEEPGYIESNNLKSKYLDRYLHPVDGWKPVGIRPDVTVTNVTVTPKYPVVGDEMVVHVSYHNASTEGVATDSRMYFWMGSGAGSQVGNIYTPYLMPSETKVIEFPYTPNRAGVYSIAAVADGTLKIIESDGVTNGENNNEGSGSVLILSSTNRAPLTDWQQPGVLGPKHDPVGDGVAASADIVNSWVFSDDTDVFFRIQVDGPADFAHFKYIVFIDADFNPTTGYPVGGAGAEFAVISGALYQYAGSGGAWSWTAVDTVDGSIIIVEDDEHFVSFKISRSLLGLEPGETFTSYITVSDEVNETADDGTIVFTYPPLVSGLLTIDGKLEDWMNEPSVRYLATDATDDGFFSTNVAPAPGELGAYADLVALWAAQDASYVFMRLQVLGEFDFTAADYAIYLDVDDDPETGYKASWDSVGADYRWHNGNLYEYTAAGGGTNWALDWEYKTGSHYEFIDTDPSQIEIALERTDFNWNPVHKLRMFTAFTDRKGTPEFEDDIDDYMPQLGLGGAVHPPYGGLLGIDGDFTDWRSEPKVRLLTTDPANDGLDISNQSAAISGSADITNVWVAHDSVDLFLLLEARDEMDFAGVDYTIYLDTDRSASTGYKVSWDTVGADYRFWDGEIYEYTGDGTSWDWQLVTNGVVYRTGAFQPSGIEIAIHRSAIEWPTNSPISLFVALTDIKGTPVIFEDDVNDFAPPLGSGGAAYPIRGDLLGVDGYFGDWAASPSVKSLGTDPANDGFDPTSTNHAAIGAYADIRSVWVANDQDDLFLRVQMETNMQPASSDYAIYLDTDNSGTTGYQISWGTVGADYRVWNGDLYSYAGDGSSWVWSQVTNAAALKVGAFDESQFELAIDRQKAELTGPKTVGLFMLSTDTKGTPGGSDDVNDFFPENAMGPATYLLEN